MAELELVRSQSKPCFIYLIRAQIRCVRNGVEDDLLKVGISDNPHGRLATFATSCPHPLEIVKTWKMPTRSTAQDVEKAVHDGYREKRTSGEWFHHFIPDMIYGIELAIFTWLETYPRLKASTLAFYAADIGISPDYAKEFVHLFRGDE